MEFKVGDRVVCRDEHFYGDIELVGKIDSYDGLGMYYVNFDQPYYYIESPVHQAGAQSMGDWFYASEIIEVLNVHSGDPIKNEKFLVDSPIDPKQSQGSKKLGFSHIPLTAYCLLSPSTKNGADKYGPLNWLDLEDGTMSLNTYLDAIQRHLILYRSGQDKARDSKVHHLDHIAAGVAVVRDAMLFNKVEDDRIKLSDAQIDILEKLINNEMEHQ